MRFWLYNLMIGVLALDALASGFVAFYIYRLRQRFGRYLALAFAGVAATGACSVDIRFCAGA